MLTYLVQPRGLYREPENAALSFPADVMLEFRLEPGGPFGEDVPPHRTVPLGAPLRINWNACRGETSIQTDARLPAVNFHAKLVDSEIQVQGSILKIKTNVATRQDLEQLIGSFFYCLPPLLGLEMLDACIFSEVSGQIGNVSFCWGLLASGSEPFDATTSEIQEERIRRAFERLSVFDERHSLANRRLLAAVQYFHIACRLRHCSGRRWEFVSETLLNYAKVLEALFQTRSNNRTIDAAREGLKALGFGSAQVETLYIPALALRNTIDVAHPTLAVFNDKQLAILQRYIDLAEDSFRKLLVRVFERVSDGRFALHTPPDTKPSKEALRVLQRVSSHLNNLANVSPPRHKPT